MIAVVCVGCDTHVTFRKSLSRKTVTSITFQLCRLYIVKQKINHLLITKNTFVAIFFKQGTPSYSKRILTAEINAPLFIYLSVYYSKSIRLLQRIHDVSI